MTLGLPQQSKSVLIVLVLALLGKVCFGATNTAASLNASDIQAAINACNAGDTAILPAGTNNLTNGITIYYKNNVNIIGAGAGGTVQNIGGGTNVWVPNNNPVTQLGLGSVSANYIAIAMAKTNFVFISGISFSNLSSLSVSGGLAFTVPNDDLTGNRFRLTNCKFTLFTGGSGDRGCLFRDIHGLCDHVYFRNYVNAGHGFDFTYDPNSYLSVTNWHTPQTYGDTNTMCVETCVFDFDFLGDGAFDAYDGQKFVFRYNSLTNTFPGWHGADSDPRAPRLWEIYENTFFSKNGFTACGAGICAGMGNCRGGTGVVWSNFWDTGWNGVSSIQLKEYRADPTYNQSFGSNPSGTFLPISGLQGPMNGSRTVDGNFAANGYPGLDQIGRGSFTVNPVVWTATFQTNNFEALEPAYFWGNNVNGNLSPSASATDFSGNAIPNIIKQGRDYFDNTPKPGYLPLPYPHPLITAALNAQQIAKVTTLRVGVTKVGP